MMAEATGRDPVLHVKMRLAGYTQDEEYIWCRDGKRLTDPDVADFVTGSFKKWTSLDYYIISDVGAVAIHTFLGRDQGESPVTLQYLLVPLDQAAQAVQELTAAATAQMQNDLVNAVRMDVDAELRLLTSTANQAL